MMPHRLLLAALAVALCGCTAQPAESSPKSVAARKSPAGLALVPLEIRSGNRSHRFTVELAATPSQQERGLMFRERVGPGEGMIFPFSPPRPAGFWMKNTMVPLDLLFIRANGTIARIAVNTEPYSLDPILSGEPVASVLELAGGRTVELGIKENDVVTWRQP